MITPDSSHIGVGSTVAETRADRRRHEILAIAGQMFLEHGYADTSMSAIAARLGGSKGTLYNYFASKELLFAAFVQEFCQKFAGDLFGFTYSSVTLADTLTGFGERFIRLLLSDNARRINRLIVAETERFPELGRMFYDAGPRVGIEKLGSLLQRQMDSGQLKAVDARMAAQHFIGLLHPAADHVRIFNLSATLSDTEIKTYVVAAVDLFLYGLTVSQS